MKRVLMVLLAVGMATAWVGCQPAAPAKPSAPPAEQAKPESDSTSSTTPSNPDSTATAEVILVTLSVPNMT